MSEKPTTKPSVKYVTKEEVSLRKKNIYEKIFNVQHGVKTVMKSGKNTHSNYEYATEKDFISEVKPLLKQERLLVIANTKTHTKVEKLHTVTVEFKIVNVDNPSEVDISSFDGTGEDKAGSAVGLPVAYTMAVKYFLAKYFLNETGTDAEAQEPEVPTAEGAPAVHVAKTEAKKPSKEDLASSHSRAKAMIASTRNIDGLITYSEKLDGSDSRFTKEQKDELKTIIKNRINELENERETYQRENPKR